MTVFRNSGISTIIETRFFYCWIQLPAVDVDSSFGLQFLPLEDKVVAGKDQAVVRLRRNHCTKCHAKRFPIRSCIRCAVCSLLHWAYFPRLWPHFFFLPLPSTRQDISSESLGNVTMNDLIKDHCILFTALGALTCSLAISPSISADATARIQIFWRRHGHEPMEIGRHVPVLDAVSKQTNRYHSLPNRWQSPEMCHIRLLSATLLTARTAWVTCCRRVTSLESWVGENTLALFSTSRNMLNGQLWLEKTDFFYCVNCHYPNFSHWINIIYIYYMYVCM